MQKFYDMVRRPVVPFLDHRWMGPFRLENHDRGLPRTDSFLNAGSFRIQTCLCIALTSAVLLLVPRCRFSFSLAVVVSIVLKTL